MTERKRKYNRIRATRRKMLQVKGSHCSKCNNILYKTILQGRLWCKKCVEYDD